MVYQEWIVELGFDPSLPRPPRRSGDGVCNAEIVTAVNQALNTLDNDEAEFIRMYYMQGKSCRQIAELTGRETHKLERMHQNAMRRLKLRLQLQLGGRFNIPVRAVPDCPLCRHPDATAIDDLIRSKPARETWKAIMKILKRRYGISGLRPQQVIGHRKYHMM